MKKTALFVILIIIFAYSVGYSETQGNKVSQNWSKLKAGMSYDEVEKLIGPICGEEPESNKACNEFRNNIKGMGVEFKQYNSYYSVEFDTNDKLKKWILK